METIDDPQQAAEEAGLVYVSADSPGIGRNRAPQGFSYRNNRGERITDERTLKRIKASRHPARLDRWLNDIARSQTAISRQPAATPRGASSTATTRSGARYARRTKYEHMIEFGQALPKIRDQVDADLRKRGLPKEKVVAAVVHLLETTLIRVGNDQYAKENKSYGLTTMRDRHVDIEGSTITFNFNGKAGVEHEIDLRDRQMARIVKTCQDLPGQRLFQYLDENGDRQSISSSDVNAYLKEITGENFTAKDFRTWAGTKLAAEALSSFEEFDSETKAKHNVVEAIESVSKKLGNTPTICRKSYVHPAVIDAYLDGDTVKTLEQRAEQEIRKNLGTLEPEEAAVLVLLQQRLQADAV